jgi:hypothetical protein
MACYEYMISLLYRDKLLRAAQQRMQEQDRAAPFPAERTAIPSRSLSNVE